MNHVVVVSVELWVAVGDNLTTISPKKGSGEARWRVICKCLPESCPQDHRGFFSFCKPTLQLAQKCGIALAKVAISS